MPHSISLAGRQAWGRLQSLILALAGMAAAAITIPGEANNSVEVGSFSELYRLPSAEAAQGLPFKARAVVLCVDRDWGQFYIHDGSETFYIDPRRFPELPKAGKRVEIHGQTTVEENQPALTNLTAVTLEAGELPPATQLGLSEMNQEKGKWIEVEGTIKIAETSLGRLRFLLEDRGSRATAYVFGPQLHGDLRIFLDRRVRIRGINSSEVSEGRLTAAVLMVPGMDAVTTLAEPGEWPLPKSTVAIGNLLNRPLGSWTNSRVRINGIVASFTPGKHVVVRDPSGVIRAETVQSDLLRPNDRVDVWGFLRLTEAGPILDFAWFERMAPARLDSSATSVAAPLDRAPLATLTSLGEVSALSREQAARGHPVRLRGTVTFADSSWGNAFLQNSEGGIYFGLSQPDVRPGQSVELTGRTAPGGFSTEIVEGKVEILGETNLPPPLKVDLSELTNGKLDADWVEIQGLVQRVDQQWGHAYLTIMTAEGKLKALVPGLDDNNPPTHLIDALVRVRGACTTEITPHQQLVGFVLQTPSLEQITVVQPAPDNPFEAPTVPSNKIAAFDPDRPAGRRVKVAGVVTLVFPNIGFVLQDEAGGLRVNSSQTGSLSVGDAVEVLGFPAIGEFSPVLDDSIFRVTGQATLPDPRGTTAEEILSTGASDQQRVTLHGYLLKPVPRSARPELIL